MSLRASLAGALLAVGLVVLAACGGGSGGSTGTLSLSITDAPFPATEDCVSAAMVTVISVEAKGEDGGFVTLLDEADGPIVIDLYELRAGLTDNLAVEEVPTGAYSEIRLVIDNATIEFADGSPAQEFKIPSGSSSGLKIKIDPPVLVASGQTTELMLDVNLSESFHTAGEGGEPTCDDLKQGDTKVIFHPVIRAMNMATTALVVGIVSDADTMPVGDVEVTAYPADTVVAADTVESAMTLSTPDGMTAPIGSYALALDPGDYDIYVRAQGVETATYAATVSVATGEIVTQDLSVP